jgi:hypothetical protein
MKNYINDERIIYGICGLLGIALLPMPYGYYTILRIIVCFISVAIAMQEGEKKDGDNIVHIVFILLSIVYNPIIIVHFKKSIWIFLNILTICCLLGYKYKK